MEKTHIIGQNIRLLRKQKGWTQSDLAEKLDCTQEVIAYYENGERTPPANKIPLFANLFGVTIDELYATKPMKANIKEKDPKLWKRFERVEQMQPADRKMVFRMIDSLATEKR
jgi:transcriptional regulator with XRE-family HTH domain